MESRLILIGRQGAGNDEGAEAGASISRGQEITCWCMATIKNPGVLPQRGMLPEIAECSIEIATGNAHSSAARMSIPCYGV